MYLLPGSDFSFLLYCNLLLWTVIFSSVKRWTSFFLHTPPNLLQWFKNIFFCRIILLSKACQIFFRKKMFSCLRVIENFKAHVLRYWRSHPLHLQQEEVIIHYTRVLQPGFLQLTFSTYFSLRHSWNIINTFISK